MIERTPPEELVRRLFPQLTSIGRGGCEVNGLERYARPEGNILWQSWMGTRDRIFYYVVNGDDIVLLRVADAAVGSGYGAFAVIHDFGKLGTTDDRRIRQKMNEHKKMFKPKPNTPPYRDSFGVFDEENLRELYRAYRPGRRGRARHDAPHLRAHRGARRLQEDQALMSTYNPYGNFEDHAGHAAADCPLRETVTADPMGSSHNGYRCFMTGGHCRPGEQCDRLRKQAVAEAAERHEFLRMCDAPPAD